MNKSGRTQDILFLGCHTNGKCIRQSTNRVMYGRERDRNKTKVEWKYLELLKIECLKKSPFDDELNVVKTLKETNRCMARKKENERMERRELFCFFFPEKGDTAQRPILPDGLVLPLFFVL